MIREARKEDAEKIIELFKIILQDMELPILEIVSWQELKPALVYAAKKKTTRHSYANAIVKEIDGEIAGFCFSYDGGLSDEVYEPLENSLKKYNLPLFETYKDEETFEGEWYLDSLVTKPSFRGRGIGKELMQATYQKALDAELSVIGLNVDHDNPKARKLYEKQGFRKTGEVILADHHYDHMQKVITE